MSEGVLAGPASLPPGFTEALLRLCRGEFDHRMPRSFERDEADMVAFFFNALAEELAHLISTSREAEVRLAITVERLREVLTHVAAGEFKDAEVARDFREDALDTLVFLVNNTVAELGHLVDEQNRRAELDRAQLVRRVEESQRKLVASEERFEKLFEFVPQPLLLINPEMTRVHQGNRRAAALFEIEHSNLRCRPATDFFDGLDGIQEIRESLARGEAIENLELALRTGTGRAFVALVGACSMPTDEGPLYVVGFADLSVQKQVELELRVAAATDTLTGTISRGRFFEIAEREWNRAARYERPICVALVDLDHFKRINDQFGHLFGDECLRSVGTCLLGAVRREDHVGRYGGEEFAVLLPESRLDAGREVVERLCAEVRSLELHAGGVALRLAMSGGVVERLPGETFQTALARADAALYRAKDEGRDRVVASES